jgi:hypothetical protein
MPRVFAAQFVYIQSSGFIVDEMLSTVSSSAKVPSLCGEVRTTSSLFIRLLMSSTLLSDPLEGLAPHSSVTPNLLYLARNRKIGGTLLVAWIAFATSNNSLNLVDTDRTPRFLRHRLPDPTREAVLASWVYDQFLAPRGPANPTFAATLVLHAERTREPVYREFVAHILDLLEVLPAYPPSDPM